MPSPSMYSASLSPQQQEQEDEWMKRMLMNTQGAYVPPKRTEAEMAAALQRDTDTAGRTAQKRYEKNKYRSRNLLGAGIAAVLNKTKGPKARERYTEEALTGLTNARAQADATATREGIIESRKQGLKNTLARDAKTRQMGFDTSKQEDQQKARVSAAKLLRSQSLEDRALLSGVEVMYEEDGTPITVQRNQSGEYFYSGTETPVSLQGLDKVNPLIRGEKRRIQIDRKKADLGKEMVPLLKLVRSTTELSKIFAEGGYNADTEGIGFIEGGDNFPARTGRLAGAFGENAQRNNRRLTEVKNEIVKQGAGLAQTLSEVANQTKALGADDLNNESTLRDGVWGLQQRLNMELDLMQARYGKEVMDAYIAELPEEVQALLTSRFTDALVAREGEDEMTLDELLEVY